MEITNIFIDKNEEEIINFIEENKHKANTNSSYMYLDYAIKNKYVNLCDYLLKDDNLDINYINNNFHDSYLYKACLSENIEILNKIINTKGIELNKTYHKYDSNALYKYCSEKKSESNIEIIYILTKKERYMCNSNGSDLLTMFLMNKCFGRYDIVKYLIDIYSEKEIMFLKIFSKIVGRGFISGEFNNILYYTCFDLLNLYEKLIKSNDINTNIDKIDINIHTIEMLRIIELIKNKINDDKYIKETIEKVNLLVNKKQLFEDYMNKEICNKYINLQKDILEILNKTEIESKTKSAAKIDI